MEKINLFLNEIREIKLELGAGEKAGKNGWITLDTNETSDINCDLTNGIPFPDASVHIIYSSHLLEHFTFKEITALLSECRRVLKPGGIFSVSVPCARFFIDAYTNKDGGFWKNLRSRYSPAFNNTCSLIDLINYIAYMDGHHKYMFDEENLIHILKLNGFQNVRLRSFDAELDSLEREQESIFAIATK